MENGLIVQLIFVLVAVLISMTLHEAMHAFAGYWLGDDTAKQQGRLTLNPIAHIDPFTTILLPLILVAIGAPPFGAAKPVPFNPERVKFGEWGAALVALAGPLTNFVLAFIGFCVWVLFPGSDLLSVFLAQFILVNLGFFIFNMIPLPPLDGARLLYAVAPEPVQRVMATMEQFGIVIVFAIVLLFNSVLGTFIYSAMKAILWLFSLPFGSQTVI